MCPVKETNFFALEGKNASDFQGPGDQKALSGSSKYVTTITDRSEYLELFQNADDGMVCGEACPLYLYHPDAPKRIRQYAPDVQLFAILRNPVDRAYSAYWMLKGAGREPAESFRKGLRREQKRIERHWEYSWHYKRVGLYAEQLRRYLQYFDRDQLHIYLFEEFVSDPEAFTRGVFRTLGLDDDVALSTSTQRNASGESRFRLVSSLLEEESWLRQTASALIPESVRGWLYHKIANANTRKPPMDTEVRRDLVEFFRSDIKALEELLDRDLSAWRKVSEKSDG
jgi:hypothetical protein